MAIKISGSTVVDDLKEWAGNRLKYNKVDGGAVVPFSEVVVQTASTYNTGGSATFNALKVLDASKAIVAYRDNSNSGHGTARVLTAAGTTITSGTKTVFNAASTQYISASVIDPTRLLVVYQDTGNSSQGTACILTINGSNISAGSEFIFNTGATTYTAVTMLDPSTALVVYYDTGASQLNARILSISSTTISAGSDETSANTPAGAADFIAICTIDSTRALIVYRDISASNAGKGSIISISGSSITIGSEFEFETTPPSEISVDLIDPLRAIITYTDGAGVARVLNISGTTVTVGTKTTFNSGGTAYTNVIALDSTKAVVVYEDTSNSSQGTACILNVSGNTITAGSETVFDTTSSFYLAAAAFDSTEIIVVNQSATTLGNARLLTNSIVSEASSQTLLNKTIKGTKELRSDLSSGSAIDLSLGNYFLKTITTTTTFTVSNVPASGTGISFVLDLTNGGSQTINWWSNLKWVNGSAPTLTSSGRDVLCFFTHDAGTTWTGLVAGKDVR